MEKVLNGINEAVKNNIKVKINTVAMKNFNENEFEELIIWADKLNIDITFIEVMPMEETDTSRYMQFAPLDKVFKN